MVRPKPILGLAALLALLLISCGRGSSGATDPAQTATRPAGSGPRVTLDPKSGPPGTEVTVSGRGWPARATLQLIGDDSGPAGKPYASVTVADDGTFVTSFRLEKTPNGDDLKVGRFDLIARAGRAEVRLPFQVETRRPVRGLGEGG